MAGVECESCLVGAGEPPVDEMGQPLVDHAPARLFEVESRGQWVCQYCIAEDVAIIYELHQLATDEGTDDDDDNEPALPAG